jgi:eukaryotic-like serine/threonine-protein kinase
VHRPCRPTARSLVLAVLLACVLAGCAEPTGPAPGGQGPVRDGASTPEDPSCVSSLRFDHVGAAARSSRLPGAAWRVNGELPVSSPVASGDAVYAGTSGILPEQGCVFAVDAHSGRVRWATRGGISPGTWPLAAGDQVLAALQGGDLVALDAGTGAARWIIETGGLWEAEPVLVGGVLYAAPSSGVLAADPGSGRLRWHVRGPVGAMVADRDGVLVSWVGASGSVTAALDPADGRERWRVRIDRPGTVVVARAHGTVVLRGAPNALYGLDAATGRRLWELDVPGDDSTPVAVARGRLLLLRSGNGYAYAVDARTGRVAWRTAVGFGDDQEPPVVDGATAYLGGSSVISSYLWALDVETGRVRWRLDTGAPVGTRPLVHGDLVMVGDAATWVYAVERRSGRLRSRYAAGGAVDQRLAFAPGWVFARVGAKGMAGIPL